MMYTIKTDDGSTFPVKMIRNRHGLYSPDQFLYKNNRGITQRITFPTNPNTGEEGRWQWLGTMGWINTQGDPQPQPKPGTIIFNPGGNQVSGPYNPEANAASAPAPASAPPAPDPVSTPPAPDPVPTPPADTMLSPLNSPNAIGSSWIDVLTRQGRDLDSWDGFLGTFTGLDQNPDWTQMNRNQVQEDFNGVWNQGLFSGLDQNQVYADLLKRLGFV